MGQYPYTKVFVPGGFPAHTYNPRTALALEPKLDQVLENLCKLAIVTGHTKSGKTVLVRNILPRSEAVWVDGGLVGEPDDFWTAIVDQLDLFQGTSEEKLRETEGGVDARGKAGANLIVAKGEAEAGGFVSHKRASASGSQRDVSSRAVALRGLMDSGVPLVIDDFHYLPREFQGEVVRALKQPIFDGLPVVVIAIPHRRYDAVKVEKEMTGRILPVNIPVWSDEELAFIPQTGFKLLDGEVSDAFTKQLTDESIGSPHLMQEFCRAICKEHGVSTSLDGKHADLSGDSLNRVFAETAETIGRPIFEKLARGPRQRSDRIARELRSGDEVDIYGLVLHGLAHLKPGLITVEYEELRSAIKDVSASNPPQLHEVARVLKHMASIAATDQSSAPVIDFEEGEKQLHVTDPFFAFYLRWGDLDG